MFSSLTLLLFAVAFGFSQSATDYYNRGVEKEKANDLDEAWTNFTKAVELKPDYAAAYYALGNIEYYKGDFDGASTNYTKAIDLKSDYAVA